jgi:hypothetical protein
MWGRVLLAVHLVTAGFVGPVRAQTPPGYLTIQLAHSAEGIGGVGCRPVANVMTLEDQAAAYRSMGVTGLTETVITSWPQQSTDACHSTYVIASWDRLIALQQNYNWHFVSGSRDYINLKQVSTTVARSEICGSSVDLGQHGLGDGLGEFAYPDNRYSTALQQIALGCGYDFGRQYSGAANPVPVPSPYWLGTYSLNGGACADPSQPCYGLSTRFHYTNPSVLASTMAVSPGTWRVVQGYTFVTGADTSGQRAWDCTSQDWHEHWTAGPLATEMYCWTDWQSALSHLRNVVFVTPAQMATI